MPKEIAMRITELDEQGQERLIAELDKNQALDALDRVDAQCEAYRRAHMEEKLKPLPPGNWGKYLNWATEREKQVSTYTVEEENG